MFSRININLIEQQSEQSQTNPNQDKQLIQPNPIPNRIKQVMMAPLKLIAALVIALSAIVLTVEADKDFESIAEEIAESIEVSKEDQADAEKVYSVAKAYVGQLNSLDKPTGEELLKAWNKVLHGPNWFARKCDESALSHIKTISLANPKSKPELRTLEEATEKYARECVTKRYIEDKIKSIEHEYARRKTHEDISKFVDDQFIADYWLEHPKDKSEGIPMDTNKAAKAIVKAIVRARGNDTKDLQNLAAVNDYLWKRLHEPCIEYWRQYRELYYQIRRASEYLEGGYQKLVTSLDNESQNSLSRSQVCADDRLLTSNPVLLYYAAHEAGMISKQVVSELKSLPAV